MIQIKSPQLINAMPGLNPDIWLYAAQLQQDLGALSLREGAGFSGISY